MKTLRIAHGPVRHLLGAGRIDGERRAAPGICAASTKAAGREALEHAAAADIGDHVEFRGCDEWSCHAPFAAARTAAWMR